MKKLLITGASGMLGSDIVPILRKKYQVFPTDIDTLDISDGNAIESFLQRIEPDWIIHLAAITDLEYCERNPAKAMNINGESTGRLAKLSKKHGKKLVYVSTSGVFSGSNKGPYTEEDVPHPVTVYGKSKLLGEKIIHDVMDPKDFMILRAGWMFGGGELDKKFVGKMFELMSKNDQVRVVSDIVGSPNYSIDIGNLIVFLIEKEAYGLFHAINEGIASRYEIALKIKEYGKFDTQVVKASADEFPTIAPRPPMEAILGQNLKTKQNYQIRDWQSALKEYMIRLCNIHNNCTY